MTFHVHRAERADRLVAGLAQVLADPLPDPFAEELVVVPARGVERWLAQQLGHRLGVSEGREDGVCAGIRFASPRSLVTELLGIEDDDPWSPDRLVWPLLDVIDDSLGEEWCSTLSRHLGHDDIGVERDLRRNRRYGVARRLAGLFASYATQRPSMIEHWIAGRDDDGTGKALDPDIAWQPELWRRLVAAVGAAPPDVRLAEAVTALHDRPASFDLPGRVSFLGHTRLSVGEMTLLEALAVHREVHLWLPHPSPVLWDGLAHQVSTGPIRRAGVPTPTDAPNALLISLGRDSRELQRTLQAVGAAHHEHLEPSEERPDTLLGWLQKDLIDDRSGVEGRAHVSTDRSIQIHACHGSARQVDVLREVLVGLLEDDPTLEPRDILVMCPDVEAYAPLIHAAFGLGGVVDDGHPAHQLRVRLADRGSASTNPLLQVATAVLNLAETGRVTATEVLDLVAMAPVRERFRLSDDDLQQLTAWVDRSGIRWAFDGDHRGPFGLGDLRSNTWQFGLDRVLLGAAVAEHRAGWIGTVLPLDDVSSGDLDLAGRLAEIVARLRDLVDRMAVAQPLGAWVDTLRHGVLSLADVPPREAWQVDQLERELSRLDAAGGGSTTPLRLAEVITLLADRLGSRPTRANFRTGTLTVCTMVPMRSVPHRVICMIGLDDGEFPRIGALHGDDVLARDPLTGERDVRSEDRQLFLDAILAATETLVVTYTGADERTGQSRPPAVPLGELIDQIGRTVDGADVVVHHPLQPFDHRNVQPGALVPGKPFSFDPAALAGARATGRSTTPADLGFLPSPLSPTTEDEISLRDLVDFCAHPVKAFLRQRLDVSVLREEEPLSDDIPIELNALEMWGVGDRILHDALAGADPVEARQAEYRRGLLPPGDLGRRLLDDVVKAVTPLVQGSAALRAGTAQSIDIDIELPDGRRLLGTVNEVHDDRLVTVTYSSLSAKHRLTSWLNLLALSASQPDVAWVAHAIGRHRSGGTHASVGPVGPEALEWLVDVISLRDLGLREPLPLPLKTSCAYVETSRRQSYDAAIEGARKEWNERTYGANDIPGERDDAHHQLVWGRGAPLEDLIDSAGERSRFSVVAHRLWDPLLELEQVNPL